MYFKGFIELAKLILAKKINCKIVGFIKTLEHSLAKNYKCDYRRFISILLFNQNSRKL